MNREIKFRGKRIDNKEWVVGNLSIEYDGSCFISYWVNELIEPENNYSEMIQKAHVVVPETVGQFTGLKDKNGKEIYEGDILKSFSSSVPSYEVFYCKSSYRLRYKLKNGEYYDWGPLYRMEEIQWEGRLPLCPDVIGNIHDNPELLNATSATTGNSHMNIDPKEGQEEVKEQPAEQVSEATESAEEGTE